MTDIQAIWVSLSIFPNTSKYFTPESENLIIRPYGAWWITFCFSDTYPSNIPHKDGTKLACEFNTMTPDGVDLSYAYNHYFDQSENERKHTISEIRQTKDGDCSTINIKIETDCGE